MRFRTLVGSLALRLKFGFAALVPAFLGGSVAHILFIRVVVLPVQKFARVCAA